MSVDEAFKGAGQEAGLEIWRIEKLKVVPWDRKKYGKFHSGDAYICLYTKKSKSGGFEWRVHFWLGKECSQDEQGVAAIKTVELDDSLGGAPVQYRETQGHESQLFTSLFPKGVQYLEGGIDTGFKKVDRDAFDPRLLHIKGRRNIRVQEVKLTFKSMNHGDSFILDEGRTLTVWIGEGSSPVEKRKALEVARRIKDEERGGRATIDVINDGEETAEFNRRMNELGEGTKHDIQPATDDMTFERKSKEIVKLYKVSDAGGELEVMEVGQYPLKMELLDTNDAFILDTGSGLFVWVGKGATKQERKGAWSNATKFITEKGYPNYTPVTMVKEGTETQVFKQNFSNWLNKGEITGIRTYQQKQVKEEIRFEASALHQVVEREADKCVDDGSGTVQIWRIENFELEPVPKNMYGHFYGGDSYIVFYTYVVNGIEHYIIYFWLGQDSSQDEQGAAALHTVALDDKYGGAPVQVRVTQFKEPEHFLRVFKGKMVIHSGGKASGFKNRFEGDSYDVDGTRLYQIKGTTSFNTRAVAVEEKAASLNSNDCFVLETPGDTYVWYGKGCSGDEREMANHVASEVTPGRTPVKVQEGNEPEAFWEGLGGKGEYSSDKKYEEVIPTQPPRLFQCSNASGRFIVEEIFDFTQEDVIEDDVMLLDTFDTVYIWLGHGANETEKRESIRIAKEYIETDPSNRKPEEVSFIIVKQGFEPPTFTANFFGWNPELWSKNKSFEEYLREIKESGKAGVQSMQEHETAAKELQSAIYPLQRLQEKPTPEGVNPAEKEKHLNDDDFQKALGMSKDEWKKVPKWKQQNIKRKANLF